jgi:XTP/dITP diphosphohydrolase
MAAKIPIHYVTSSKYKVQESSAFLRVTMLNGGDNAVDLFQFHIRDVKIKEGLEIDLCAMVKAEVTEAYSRIKVPCIVEHAGLLFDSYDDYPGGLTKPMWMSLKDKFIEETHSAGRLVTAKAVVGYCDGKSVYTFVGETHGKMADAPRGDRAFYWDTVFIPDEAQGDIAGNTYAEIVQAKGVEFKMEHFSQSARALKKFLEFRRVHSPEMWSY